MASLGTWDTRQLAKNTGTPAESTIQELVSKLAFIGKLKPGEKIEVKNLSVWENNLVTQFHRTFVVSGESREVSLEFITTLISKAFEVSETLLAAEDELSHDGGCLVVSKLKLARDGLNSLADTYSNDRLCTSQIETIQEMLTLKLDVLMKKYSTILGPLSPTLRSSGGSGRIPSPLAREASTGRTPSSPTPSGLGFAHIL